MKKTLLLAAIAAIGVSTSAIAANPFADVPAGHWAYDSVAKLAAAGIIEGYGDNTFCGDKLMTRYEMAQIISRAMAKGYTDEKLVGEFAPELLKLGNRIYGLEKKADNLTISGTIAFHHKSYYGKGNKAYNGTNNYSRIRSDINLKGNINQAWSYNAMVRNEQYLGKGDKNSGEESTNLHNAYVEGKLGGLQVTAGRFEEFLADGYIHDWCLDGVKALYGGEKLNLMVGYAQLDNANDAYKENFLGQHLFYTEANAAVNKAVNMRVGYYDLSSKEKLPYYGRKLMNGKLGLTLSDSLSLSYNYIHSDKESPLGGNRAHNITLNYKEADPEVVGSYGIEVVHYDQDSGTYLANLHTLEASVIGFLDACGFKGWSVSAGATIAKNVVANLTWYDLQTKAPGRKDHAGTLYCELNYNF